MVKTLRMLLQELQRNEAIFNMKMKSDVRDGAKDQPSRRGASPSFALQWGRSRWHSANQ